MGLTIDWTEHDDLTPREQYDYAGQIIDEAKAAAAARRARIAHDLMREHGAQEAASILGISDKRVYQLATRYKNAQPVICDNYPGRSISSYDLLEEVEAHGMSRRDAHEAIHAVLHQLIECDGEDEVIIDRRPQQPGLLQRNCYSRSVRYWLVIRSEYADHIRELLTTQPPNG